MNYTANQPGQNAVIPPQRDIRSLLTTKLTPLPGSVMRILELLRNPDVPTNSLSTAVGCDPMLAARLLRLANSTYYARERNVTTIHQAIETIGTKALYDAVMLGITANSFAREIQGSKLGRAIWHHSLAVALLSREISDQLGMRGTESAFMCGLLHDIGKFILLRADKVFYELLSEAPEEDENLVSEEKAFGVDHAELGALMVNRWGLPEAISTVILYHHDPARAPQAIVTAHIVNVADMIAEENGHGLSNFGEIGYLQSDSISALRLTQNQMVTAWENIVPHLTEMSGTFDQQ